MLLAVPPYFRVLMPLHSFVCIRSATRTSNLAHLPGKCFSSEDSHTEISKRFAWNALSRWHFISASLHLLYLHMFIVQNQKYYCIILRLCQRSHLSISECYDFNSPIFLLLCVAFLLFPYFTTSTQKKVQSTVSQMIDVISSILRASLNLEVRCLSRSSGEFARTDFNR